MHFIVSWMLFFWYNITIIQVVNFTTSITATAVDEAYIGPSFVLEYRMKTTRKVFCSTSKARAAYFMLNRFANILEQESQSNDNIDTSMRVKPFLIAEQLQLCQYPYGWKVDARSVRPRNKAGRRLGCKATWLLNFSAVIAHMSEESVRVWQWKF